MALEALHDTQHQSAVSAHDQTIGVEFYMAGQHRRIDQVDVQDRQAPDLTVAGSG